MPSDEYQPATTADVQRVDQKTDRIAAELVKTQGRMDQMQNQIEARMDAGFSRVLSAIDAFARKAETYDRAAILHGRALVEVEVQLKDHEKRLSDVESRRP